MSHDSVKVPLKAPLIFASNLLEGLHYPPNHQPSFPLLYPEKDNIPIAQLTTQNGHMLYMVWQLSYGWGMHWHSLRWMGLSTLQTSKTLTTLAIHIGVNHFIHPCVIVTSPGLTLWLGYYTSLLFYTWQIYTMFEPEGH